MDWFVSIDNQKYGPYALDDIIHYIEEGSITSEHFIWRSGFPDWKAAGQVEDLAHYFPQEKEDENNIQKNNRRIYSNLYKLALILCFLAALGFFGFRTYSFFQDGAPSILDPVQITVSPEGENIADTVKLGQVEIPFTQVFAVDTSGDGYPDRRSYYQDDLLVLAAWDTDADGAFDLWFRFVNGEYVDLEAYDLTGDGNIEKLVSVDENENVTAVELLSEENKDIPDAVKALALPALPVLFFCLLLVRTRRRLSR